MGTVSCCLGTGYRTQAASGTIVDQYRLIGPASQRLIERHHLQDRNPRGEFGKMVALRGNDVVGVSLEEATAKLKTVPQNWLDLADVFFK